MKKLVLFCILILTFISSVKIFSQPKWERMIFLEGVNANWRIDLLTNNGKDIVLCGNYFFEGPFVVTSNDSGRSWYYTLRDKQIKLPDGKYYLPEEAQSIAYPDSSLCLIACDSGYFWRSTDNAQTWERTKYPDIYKPNEIKFWNNKKGVITVITPINNKGRTYKTEDGGLTWERFYFPEFDSVESSIGGLFVVVDTSRIIMYTKPENDLAPYRLKMTNDFGKNIEYYNLPSKDVHRLYFINDKVGFWYGGIQAGSSNYVDKIIYRTQNGGKTWYNVLKDSEKAVSYIFDIHFCDSLNGIASGMTKIFRTKDGGEHWFVDTCFKYSEFQHYLGYVALLNPNVAIAVDNSIFRIDYSQKASSVTNVSNNNIKSDKVIVTSNNIDLKSIYDFEFKQESKYFIYNYLGELIQSGLIKDNNIDVKNLSSGLYFVNIIDIQSTYLMKILLN